MHWPIIILYGFKKEDDFEVSKLRHAVVMTGNSNNTNLIVRNSLSGQTIFGEEEQASEHEVENKITTKLNQWNLGNEYAQYIEFI